MLSKYLIAIVGPTAVGKTACCISLAQAWQTEIISADSRQFYKEMSIGTAKPTPEERATVPHHFVDFLPITASYSAGKFEREVLHTLDMLWQSHDTLLLTGGSGLYIDAVCDGIIETPPTPPAIAQQLEQQYEKEGIESLCRDLAQHDPTYYAQVDRANPHRLLRALALFYTTGKPYSSFLAAPPKPRDFQVIKIGLTRPRDELYERIEKRVDIMMKEGLLAEAEVLYKQGFTQKPVIGYRELFGYFAGESSLAEAIAAIKRNTRHYAKRQMTWFRRDQKITWFASDEINTIQEHIAQRQKAERNNSGVSKTH